MADIASIEIDGIQIEPLAGGKFDQTYGDQQVSVRHRMGDGALVQQTLEGTAGKLTTRISASGGWIPLGLQGFDWRVPHTLRCGAPLSVLSATQTVDVPPNRRSDGDYGPKGFAIVNRREVETNIDSWNGDEATLAPVNGATAYGVHYVPEITAWIAVPSQGISEGRANFAFEIVAEEV